MTEIEYWLQERVEVTHEDIRSYFNTAKKYRGMWFVEMKRQLSIQLKKEGLKHREICEMLKTSNSMISILSNRTKALTEKDVIEVRNGMNEWIKKGLYPKSFCNHDYTNGYQETTTIYKLVKHYEL